MKLRLVSLMMCAGLGATAAHAQKTISVGYDKPQQVISSPLHLRHGSQSEQPMVSAGLQVEKFTDFRGGIRAMAVRENGDILILETGSNHLSVVTDRDKDGNPDMTRRLPTQFNNPVSLVAEGDQIYVVDQSAVWEVSKTGQTMVASLQNIKANFEYRPLIMAPKAQFLYLGLSHDDGTSRIVAIDRSSGQAQPVASGPGQIRALAQSKGTALWVGLENKIVPVQGQSYDPSLGVSFPDHVSVDQIYLPTQDSLSARGVNRLAGQFLVSLRQDNYVKGAKVNGRRLVGFNSAFGQPNGDPVSILSGFLANHGRSSWGQPGPGIWDERGLFVGDVQSGAIWRISQLVPKIRIVEKPKEPIKFYESDEIKKPKASWGSSIENGSSIISGSHLATDWETSSLIPKETLMEKLRKEEEGEEEEDEE